MRRRTQPLLPPMPPGRAAPVTAASRPCLAVAQPIVAKMNALASPGETGLAMSWPGVMLVATVTPSTYGRTLATLSAVAPPPSHTGTRGVAWRTRRTHSSDSSNDWPVTNSPSAAPSKTAARRQGLDRLLYKRDCVRLPYVSVDGDVGADPGPVARRLIAAGLRDPPTGQACADIGVLHTYEVCCTGMAHRQRCLGVPVH